jgi:hypothetical protein
LDAHRRRIVLHYRRCGNREVCYGGKKTFVCVAPLRRMFTERSCNRLKQKKAYFAYLFFLKMPLLLAYKIFSSAIFSLFLSKALYCAPLELIPFRVIESSL